MPFYGALLNRAQELPGIQLAALVDALPMTGYDTWFVFDAEGHPRDPRQLALEASSRIVSPGYFQLMGIHMSRGRWLTADDRSGNSRAVLVSAAEANQLWPNQDPIGKHLISVADEPTPGVMDMNTASIVVGVVSGTHHEGLDKDAGWETYLPLTTRNEKPVMNILLRSNAGSAELASSLRGRVAELNQQSLSPRCARLRA